MRLFSALLFFCPAVLTTAQTIDNNPDSSTRNIPLVVPSGVPLRVYLTKRLPKRVGEPVDAKLLEPVFAFDRIVVPAGSQVLGQVSRLQPVTKMRRASAILGGDFTPLHDAEVQFTTLVMPDGRKIPLQTAETIGLNTIVPRYPRKARPVQTQTGGILGMGKHQAQTQIDAAKDKLNSIADMVRGPDKKELVEDFLIKKLPYHPQWVRRGTRFDAELSQPLEFGVAAMNADSLRLLGTQPPPDSIAHIRLMTDLSSGTAEQGDPVDAVLSQPLFSADHKLILPEGTRLSGSVAFVHSARWLHRGGQMRFSFQNVDLPAGLTRAALDTEPQTTKTQAALASVESAGTGKVKVDEEGGVKATEPKTRFIAPIISFLVATKSADHDTDRDLGKLPTSNGNVGGRSLGGASGFGLLGMAASQASPMVGTVFGFYGLAWSVYSNILSRGSEVEFDKNAAMDIRFGGRIPIPAAASKLRASHPSAAPATN